MKRFILSVLILGLNWALSQIELVSEPQFSWVNSGGQTPIIRLFFKAEISIYSSGSPVYIRVSLPGDAVSISAFLGQISSCCELPSSSLTPLDATVLDGFYFLKLNIALSSSQIYGLVLWPGTWPSSGGFLPGFSLAIVSTASTQAVEFANLSLTSPIYVWPETERSVVAQESVPIDMTWNQRYSSRVRLKITDENVQRILFQTTGDFAYDANPGCLISELEVGEYTCGFPTDFGSPIKFGFLEFKGTAVFPKGWITVYYFLRSPSGLGVHGTRVRLLSFPASQIINSAELEAVGAVKAQPWPTGSPSMSFSFNLPADSETLPVGLGLFSMSQGYTQTFNSLHWAFEMPILPLGIGSVELRVHLGDPAAIVPLGRVFHNLPASSGEPTLLFSEGTLRVIGATVVAGTTYKISLKVGYPTAVDLRTDMEAGLGLLELVGADGQVLVRGRPNTRVGFERVAANASPMSAEYMGLSDTRNKRYRGMSSFRSADRSAIGSAADVAINPGRNGLRSGTGQSLWFAANLGPNDRFWAGGDLPPAAEGGRVVVDVYLSPAFKSTTPAFPDSDAASNCFFRSPRFNKLSSELGFVEASTAGGDPTATFASSDYSFIDGCAVSTNSNLTRLRLRLGDRPFTSATGTGSRARAVEVALVSQTQLTAPAGLSGNAFGWHGVDVPEPGPFSPLTSGAIVFDAFVVVRFQADVAATNSEFRARPSAVWLDNMVILSTDTSSLPPASLIASLHNAFLVPAVTGWVSQPATLPAILHLSGTLTPPLDAVELVVFIDLVAPLPITADSSNVDCGAAGAVSGSGCKLLMGCGGLQETAFSGLDGSPGFLYRTSQTCAHGLRVPLAGTGAWAMAIAVAPPRNDAAMKLAALASGSLRTSLFFVFLDAAGKQLARLDAGIGAFYEVEVAAPWMNIPSLASVTKDAALTARLVDSVVDDNPSNSVWLEATEVPAVQGGISDMYFVTNCDVSCAAVPASPARFPTATFCAGHQLQRDTTLSFNNGGLGISRSCLPLSGWQSGGLRSCVFCPGVAQRASPALDSSKQKFRISGMRLPATGLAWPRGSVAAVSNGILISMQDLTGLGSQLLPAVTTIGSPSVAVPNGSVSSNISFRLSLGLSLASGALLELAATAGCEEILALRAPGLDGDCQIDTGGVLVNARYKLVQGGIRVVAENDLAGGTSLQFLLKGVSVLSPRFETSCGFLVRAYAGTSGGSDSTVQSSYPALLTFDYASAVPTVLFTLTSVSIQPATALQLAEVKVTISLTGRQLLKSDRISVSMGSLLSLTRTEDLRCEILRGGVADGVFETCDLTDAQNAVIIAAKDSTDLDGVFLRLTHVLLPPEVDTGVSAVYLVNGVFPALETSEYSPPQPTTATGFIAGVAAWLRRGFPAQWGDLELTFAVDLSLDAQSTISLSFPRQFLPFLSDAELSARLEWSGGATRLVLWFAGPFELRLAGLPSLPSGSQLRIRLFDLRVPVADLIGPAALRVDTTTASRAETVELAAVTGGEEAALCRVENVVSSTSFLRETGGLRIDFSCLIELTTGTELLVFLGHLRRELLKRPIVTCSLYSPLDNASLSSGCDLIGTRLSLFLTRSLSADFTARLAIEGLPTPDTADPAALAPALTALNPQTGLVVAASFAPLSDGLSPTFGPNPNLDYLEFNLPVDGSLSVPRGFYSVVGVKVAPDPSDSLPKAFARPVGFALAADEAGVLTSVVLPSLGIDTLAASPGQFSASFVLGARYNSSFSNYAAYVKRIEIGSSVFSELPLLSVQVIDSLVPLIVPSVLTVYLGSESLPFKVTPSSISVETVLFDLIFFGDPLLFISELEDNPSFEFSPETPHIMKILSCKKTTNITSATLQISAINTYFSFAPVNISIVISPKITFADPQIQLSFSNILSYSASLVITGQEISFIRFHLYLVSTSSKPEISETEFLSGAPQINSTRLFWTNLESSLTNSIPINSLLSSSIYALDCFYRTPDRSYDGKLSLNFATTIASDFFGQAGLIFSDPISIESKVTILQLISSKLRIDCSILYSDEGLTCDTSSVRNITLEYIKAQYVSQAFKTFTFNIRIYAPKKEGLADTNISILMKSSDKKDPVTYFKYLTNYQFDIRSVRKFVKYETFTYDLVSSSSTNVDKAIITLELSNPQNITLHSYLFINFSRETDIASIATIDLITFEGLSIDRFFSISYGQNSTSFNLLTKDISGRFSISVLLTHDTRPFSPNVKRFDINIDVPVSSTLIFAVLNIALFLILI